MIDNSAQKTCSKCKHWHSYGDMNRGNKWGECTEGIPDTELIKHPNIINYIWTEMYWDETCNAYEKGE